jgi:adhesin transport system outer membrane protein
LATEDEIVAMTLACSPRLKALQALRVEVDAERRVARSRLFPQVVAQGSTSEITGTRAGLAVRLQTGNGLSQLSAVEAVEAQIVSAEFELATNQRDIREQVRLDYLTFMAGRDRALASTKATRSSDSVTESYKRQFITGRRTWLDVMNAVRESQSAKLTEADAELGTLAAYSRLMLRSCQWTPAPISMEGN